jgi:hypothetical protein
MSKPTILMQLLHEVLAGQDRGARAVRGRAALQLGERLVDHRCRQDVLERVLVLELRVGVVHRVLVVLVADLREHLGLGAVLLHVLAAGIAEHLRRGRRLGEAAQLDHQLHVLVERHGAVGVLDAEGALLHLLEAERHRAVRDAALDELLGQEQRRRARGAVVVDVVDRHAGEADLVDGALAAGGVAVAVADRHLLDGVVGDLRVGQRLLAGLLRHLRVVPFLAAGLLELRHADTDHVDLARHRWDSS